MLAHAGVRSLIVEFPIWRALTQSPGFSNLSAVQVLVTEAPKNVDLKGAQRWEECECTTRPASSRADVLIWRASSIRPVLVADRRDAC